MARLPREKPGENGSAFSSGAFNRRTIERIAKFGAIYLVIVPTDSKVAATQVGANENAKVQEREAHAGSATARCLAHYQSATSQARYSLHE